MRSPERPCLVVVAGLVATLTFFHGATVLLINSPSNAIKVALRPIISLYDGPWLSQSWSLFAPTVPTADFHVIVRGRTLSRKVTPWYDATRFFQDMSAANRFTTLRPSSEGLYHAAEFTMVANRFERRSISGILLVRTAAMVLQTYSGDHKLSAMQIELDRVAIETAPKRAPRTERVMRLDWMPFPHVVDFRS